MFPWQLCIVSRSGARTLGGQMDSLWVVVMSSVAKGGDEE